MDTPSKSSTCDSPKNPEEPQIDKKEARNLMKQKVIQKIFDEIRNEGPRELVNCPFPVYDKVITIKCAKVEPRPLMRAWIEIGRNVECKDEKVLHNQPYFGDDVHAESELKEVYKCNSDEEDSDVEMREDTEEEQDIEQGSSSRDHEQGSSSSVLSANSNGSSSRKAIQISQKRWLNINSYKSNILEHESHIACNCKGRCDESCRCFTSYCEDDCKCPSDCVNRFIGCLKCKGGCGAQCLCFIASRECDSHCKCKSCENKPTTEQKEKKLEVKVSKIAGYGCFTQETIEKGEYITEYCGEVISNDEAERRGVIYKYQKCSYIFKLSSDKSLDATRKGSKIRFANSSKTKMNCVARNIRANKEDRIAIYALKKINIGEELLLDYNYNEEDEKTYFNSKKT